MVRFSILLPDSKYPFAPASSAACDDGKRPAAEDERVGKHQQLREIDQDGGLAAALTLGAYSRRSWHGGHAVWTATRTVSLRLKLMLLPLVLRGLAPF